MDSAIPLLVISGMPKQLRSEFTEQLVLMALPTPAGQRLTFAALAAERQVRRQARVDQQMVEEAIKNGSFKDPADLAEKAPALSAAFNKLDAAVQAVLFPGDE